MEITGKVHEVSEILEIKEGFKKRELIVEYVSEGSQYSEFLKFEAIQDKVSLFDKLKAGDEIEVAFNLRGRAWTDKAGKVSYFNSMLAWRIRPIGIAKPSETTDSEHWTNTSAVPSTPENDEMNDDLPF